ncbi:MAG: hypothetical protein DRI48_08525 [Chloroflexi bacterium]|nr:MAG: hypothetical protein DRI48_08525 [Chloroflexota bacterium]
MCLARIEFAGEEEQGPDVFGDVARIERTAGGLRIIDLFGNTAELDAEILSVDFMESVVTVEKRATAPASKERH